MIARKSVPMLLLASLLQTGRVGAQAHSICGDPPPVADETLKGEIAARAQVLSRYVGGAEVSGEIENSRREIFSKYPDAERSRANAYFEYQVCVLIMNDKSMSESQKLEELKKVRREFHSGGATPSPQSASPNLSGLWAMLPGGDLIRVTQLEPGRYSFVQFKLDGSPTSGRGILTIRGDTVELEGRFRDEVLKEQLKMDAAGDLVSTTDSGHRLARVPDERGISR